MGEEEEEELERRGAGSPFYTPNFLIFFFSFLPILSPRGDPNPWSAYKFGPPPPPPHLLHRTRHKKPRFEKLVPWWIYLILSRLESSRLKFFFSFPESP